MEFLLDRKRLKQLCIALLILFLCSYIVSTWARWRWTSWLIWFSVSGWKEPISGSGTFSLQYACNNSTADVGPVGRWKYRPTETQLLQCFIKSQHHTSVYVRYTRDSHKVNYSNVNSRLRSLVCIIYLIFGATGCKTVRPIYTSLFTKQIAKINKTRNVGQCPTWWPPCRM